MSEKKWKFYPTLSNNDLQQTAGSTASDILEPCRNLLQALSQLARQKQALDADYLDMAPLEYQEAVLEAVRSTRHDCDLWALAVQAVQSKTGDSETIRRDVLALYSARVNPDISTLIPFSKLPVSTILALYPSLTLQPPGLSPDPG